MNAPFRNLTAIATGFAEAMGLAFAGERVVFELAQSRRGLRAATLALALALALAP